jgi:hypothetical protein
VSNTATQSVAPGQLFNVPGVPGGETEYFDQWEDTYQLAVTMSQASQVTVNGITKFRQTDVVLDWELELTVTETITVGTSTVTASPYAPHNFVGPVRLPIQNQYASVDVPNGIDLYIFDLIRPYYQQGQFPIMGADPFGFPAGGTATGYPAVANAGPNPVFPTQWIINTGVAKTYTLDYRIPAAQYFDLYYDRAITGEATSAPHAAYVSPQYMAGTTRNILPQVKLNPGFGGTLDNGPTTNGGAGTGTYVASGLLTFRRYGVFAGNPAAAPLEYPWQYRRFATQYGLGNQSLFSVDIPQETGQLMAWFIRFFDPGAAAGLGAPIVLLPPGVIAFDLAQTEAGLITNEKLLNTLTTAGMRIRVLFNTNPSASAYAVLGLESLVYVT